MRARAVPVSCAQPREALGRLGSPFLRLLGGGGGAVAVWGALAGVAYAEEPRSASEPAVLSEPGRYTDVADGSSREGRFDLRVSLGYRQHSESGTVLREFRRETARGVEIASRAVAEFQRTTSRLQFRAEVGVLRDVSLSLTLPVLLGYQQSLEAAMPAAEQSAAVASVGGEALFVLPFESPIRGGLEALVLGFDVGLTNQFVDHAMPTIVVGGSLSLSLGEPMRACQRGFPCYAPSVSSSSRSADAAEEPNPASAEGATRSAGASPGTTAIEAHVRASRRYRALEPYSGFALTVQRPNDNSDFVSALPVPWRATVDLGAEWIVWELVEYFQRLSLDAKLSARYTGRGQDYSAVFDALGSSAAPSFRDGEVSTTTGQSAPTGVTVVDAHGCARMALQAHWRVGRYVRFDLGSALSLTPRHWLTLGGSREQLRPDTDLAGRRFLLGSSRIVSGWVRSTVLF